MNTQDLLVYTFGIGFLVLMGFLSYAAYWLAQSLKRLTSILQNAENVTNDVSMFKNWIKLGLLNLLSMFLKRGGEKNVK